jgi:CHAT domain-containing protein/Tfp pilus assembly protein PilF
MVPGSGSCFRVGESVSQALMAASLAFASSAVLVAQDPLPPQNVPSLEQGNKVQNQAQASPLEPGKPTELRVNGPTKQAYSFELSQGAYTSILVDCPNLSAMAYLRDPSGAIFDRTYNNPKSRKENMEVVAEKPGRYGIEIEAKPTPDGGRLCTLQMASSRAASARDVALQQARSLAYQGVTLKNADKRDEAEERIRKSLQIREQLLGPEDPSIVFPLTLLGGMYLNKTDYSKAAAFYERALKVQDKNDPAAGGVFAILNNLAIIYFTTDRFGEAEQALLRAIMVAEKIYGAGRPAAINAMVNLANVYDEQGNYVKAQQMYERALADGEKAMGPDYPGLATILSNLAGVYSERGDYPNGVRLGQRAVAIAEKSGKEDQHLALALVTVGDAYRFQGDLERAKPLYERSLKIYEQVLGPEDLLVADNLDYLADIYRQQHDFDKAEELYRRALEIRKKKLGGEHSSVGASLDNLATLYMANSDYARAEPLYRQALAIRERVLGGEHPDVAATLTSLAALEMATGHGAQAKSLLSRAIAISERNSGLNLVTGSERQKLAYVRLSSEQLDRALTLNASLAPDPEAARLALTTALQRKGRVQDALVDSLKALRQHLSPEGAKLLDQLDEVTSHLARLVLQGPEQTPLAEHENRINALKEQREHLETEISSLSNQFRAASQPVTLDAVRAALPANSALIEFLNYRRVQPLGANDTNGAADTRYVAFVVHPSGDVMWKELGEAGTIDRAIDSYRQALRDPASDDIKQLARNLDEKVLHPLRPLLGDASHLLISPDGQLSLMPFEALLDEHNQYTIESYLITYLTTGRDLVRMQVKGSSKTGPVVIADPAFGDSASSTLAKVDRPNLGHPSAAGRRRSVTTAADLSGVYFAPLAGTAQEARSIQALFPGATVVTGADASVATLRRIEAPSILHVATHGFFLEDRGSSSSLGSSAARGIPATLDTENPLLRAGLAFAGANRIRSGKDNGILTALEASTLNLWGTKLVTLSACDTGIGEVRDREGVYGLRRAFVLAGAESMVMSLWPVSDRVTREMMTGYYSGLKRGLGRGEALRQAELAMLRRKDRRHPFYWASFIQSGEWANLDNQR